MQFCCGNGAVGLSLREVIDCVAGEERHDYVDVFVIDHPENNAQLTIDNGQLTFFLLQSLELFGDVAESVGVVAGVADSEGAGGEDFPASAEAGEGADACEAFADRFTGKGETL